MHTELSVNYIKNSFCSFVLILFFNVMFAQVSGFGIVDLCVIFVFIHIFFCALINQLITFCFSVLCLCYFCSFCLCTDYSVNYIENSFCSFVLILLLYKIRIDHCY